MSLELIFSSPNIDKVIEDVGRIGLNADKAAEGAATILLDRTRKRFLAQKDPDGVKWPVSKAARIRMAGDYTWGHGKKWTGTGTLFASGTLFHSIRMKRRGEAKYSVYVDLNQAPYAVYHQYGKGQVQRRILGIGSQDMPVILKYLTKFRG